MVAQQKSRRRVGVPYSRPKWRAVNVTAVRRGGGGEVNGRYESSLASRQLNGLCLIDGVAGGKSSGEAL